MEPQINTDERGSDLNQLTRRIIACVYRVSNRLGCGFLEKIYENALAMEMRRAGLSFRQQHSINVFYYGAVIGQCLIDILVDDRVVVELKSARGLDEVHVAQCLNYLKASGLGICLLVNFGTPRVKIRRIISTW